jgi:leader peptidase (prepilin peptidase)/N-methyltransferase
VAFALVALWAISRFADTVRVVPFVLLLIAYFYLAAISIALALIDIDVHRLPNAIVLPAYIVGAVLLVLSSILSGDLHRLVSAGIGMAALFVLYLVMAIIYPGGMGLGDVKLAGVLGLFTGWLSWASLAVGALSAFVLGGLFGAVLLIARRANRKTGIPFGPWMLAGAWVGIAAGDAIGGWYLALFGLA